MTKLQKEWKTILGYFVAAILPCCIVLIVFYSLGIFPFGDSTIATWDLSILYTYFYEWFGNVLNGDGSIFYSFSKSLGGNMYGTFAGFMVSPVSWLMFFFSEDNIIDFVTLSIIIKFGLAGLTSFHYIKNRFSLPLSLCLVLSVCYSMMLFNTTQSANPMWMDAVALLPLVMLGIYKLVYLGRSSLFFWSLLAAILIDWYNGYMICLFIILFYIFESFLAVPWAKENGLVGRLKCLVRPGRFSIVFTLSILASFVILLPTALSMLAGKGSVPGGLFDFGTRYDFVDVLRSFLLGVYEKEYLPQLYTGMFTFICMIWFFIDKSINRRERIASFIFLFILVISTWFAPFDRIWCGLRDGNSFYCRYTFLISGLMVFISAKALSSLSEKSTAPIVISGIATFIIGVITWFSGDIRLRYFIAISMMAVFVPLYLVLLTKSPITRRRMMLSGGLSVLLLLAVSLEASLSARGVFAYRLTSSNDSSLYSHYDDYYNEGQVQFDELDSSDGTDVDAYRLEKLYGFFSPDLNIAGNESLVYGYSQLSSYNSGYDDRVQNVLSALGYSGDWNCITTYNDPILLSDSLLGVRYVAADECPNGFTDAGLAIEQDGDIFYENPYALSLGYGTSFDIVTQEIEKPVDGSTDKNPFDYQNAFISAIMGEEIECYKRVDYKLIERTDTDITWSVDVPAGSYVYGYIAGNPWLSLGLYEDGEFKYTYMDQWSHGVFPLTSNADDATITVSLEAGGESVSTLSGAGSISEDEQFEAYFYVLDMDEFNKVIDRLSSSSFNVATFDDGYVVGSYETDSDGYLFTSIPYDSGWSITVNGESVDYYNAQDAFIVIPVNAGEDDIVMTYTPDGFVLGAIITLISIGLYVGFSVMLRRKDNKRGGLPCNSEPCELQSDNR